MMKQQEQARTAVMRSKHHGHNYRMRTVVTLVGVGRDGVFDTHSSIDYFADYCVD